MKNRRFVRLLAATMCMVCLAIIHIHVRQYDRKLLSLAAELQTDSQFWEEQLSSLPTMESAVIQGCLTKFDGFIKEIGFEPKYPGIYLITKDHFPIKDGILLSLADISPISRDVNTGMAIELLAECSAVRIYRLFHYWD